MKPLIALATVADSRSDFYSLREPLVSEERQAVGWLCEEFSVLESDPIRSNSELQAFVQTAKQASPAALVVHIPIWGDPIFSLQLANLLSLPVLLLGNDRPDTSSLVGILGAGGALDQAGLAHQRVFEHRSEGGRRQVRAFLRAACALQQLRGQKLGLFGGRSLGIFTTIADPAQWQRLFGVDVEYFDQLEIVQVAENLPQEELDRFLTWFTRRLGSITHSNVFTPPVLEKQMRSYLATKKLIQDYGIDFVGVKCQPELSDGYVTQCVSHMLHNGRLDAGGEKDSVVHACESDADGALSMQILRLISGGMPAGLLDVRWYNPANKTFVLANCGALAASFFATPVDPDGFSSIHMGEHVFGLGGGGALPGVITPQPVTLARLCRKNGEYWMAILPGEVINPGAGELSAVTPAFPKALVKTEAGADFLAVFGSNHIHMVSGNYSEELATFCRLVGIHSQIWQ
jgi:L-fucose/D-arabinose isomerase